MTNSIDSGVDGAIHRIGERRSTPRKSGDGPATGEAVNRSTDLLNLTGRARELRTLQQDLAKSPAFDTGRVGQLREAVISGRYEVNAERIADKLLALEADLP
jgi:negative regulator of flagellin synthesis FlgM